MRCWIYAAVMVAVAVPVEASSLVATPGEASMMPPAQLQALVEGFAGRPAIVDRRLLLPDCAAPELAWAGGSVMVRCAAPDWRVFVPVAGAVMPAAAVDANCQPLKPVSEGHVGGLGRLQATPRVMSALCRPAALHPAKVAALAPSAVA